MASTLSAHPLALKMHYPPLSQSLLSDSLPELQLQFPPPPPQQPQEACSAQQSNFSVLLCVSALYLQWQLGPAAP